MMPAIDAVMGSLPRARAGVGSAVNDITWQVGGALGVAVVGSAFSSRYRDGLDGIEALLPPEALGPASDSIGGALLIAAELGADGAPLVGVARAAFLDAMWDSMLLTAAIAGLAAALAFALLPARETRTPEEIEEAFLAGTLPRGESLFEWLVRDRRGR
jgi:DHA2 family multidrug resistance protein-like MFS transporter